MSRTYSPKTFLRLAPNTLLKAYFAKKGLLKDVDFDKLGETNVDPIMQAINGATGLHVRPARPRSQIR
jgi:hypothetical protein